MTKQPKESQAFKALKEARKIFDKTPNYSNALLVQQKEFDLKMEDTERRKDIKLIVNNCT